MCLEAENYNEGAQYESPETDWLGRVVLGFPKPLEYTNSLLYQLFDLSGLTDPLRDGLNFSSSLVLDVALGQLSPLPSFCFFLQWFFSFLVSVFPSRCPFSVLYLWL